MASYEDELDQTLTVTICLDDNNPSTASISGVTFFDLIEQPSTNNFLVPVDSEILIAQIPTPINQILQLRLNPPGVGTMRNWEYVAALLGMSIDEIAVVRNHPNPMEKVLNDFGNVSFSTLLAAIADVGRLDVLISLRSHLRHIRANLVDSRPTVGGNSVSLKSLSFLPKREVSALPENFILITHHERSSQEQHNVSETTSTLDSAICLPQAQTVAGTPRKLYRKLWCTFKAWAKTAGISVLDIESCIDEANTIDSLQKHFDQAQQIVLVASKAYKTSVCDSRDLTADPKLDIKRHLHEMMNMEYSNNGRLNKRFRVILLDSLDRSYLPIGWPSSTIVYTFPENHIEIAKRLFVNSK